MTERWKTCPLTITLRPVLGCGIEDASKAALKVANTLGVAVEFKFNDALCTMPPMGSVDRLVAAYESVPRKGAVCG